MLLAQTRRYGGPMQLSGAFAEVALGAFYVTQSEPTALRDQSISRSVNNKIMPSDIGDNILHDVEL